MCTIHVRLEKRLGEPFAKPLRGKHKEPDRWKISRMLFVSGYYVELASHSIRITLMPILVNFFLRLEMNLVKQRWIAPSNALDCRCDLQRLST